MFAFCPNLIVLNSIFIFQYLSYYAKPPLFYLRQNKKQVLLQFLFGRAYSYQPSTYSFEALQDQIQALKNEINSLAQQVERLQQKIIELENNQTLEIKKAIASQYGAGFALRQLLKQAQKKETF